MDDASVHLLDGVSSEGFGKKRDHHLTVTRDDDETTRSKKFIFNLVSSLHKAGHHSFLTEERGVAAARALGLNAQISVFPVTAVISFVADVGQLDASTSESYTIRIGAGYDLWRLQRLQLLCRRVMKRVIALDAAELELSDIDGMAPLYENWMLALAFGCVSASASTLFYGGSWVDGAVGAVLGMIVFFMGLLCGKLSGLAEMECFVSSAIVAALAAMLDMHVFKERTCLFACMFGGVVWLLPGVSIATALQELYSRMIVYGSSRLLYGTGQALQLGFGLALGYRLVYRQRASPDSFRNGCRESELGFPSVDRWFVFIILPVVAIGMGMIVNAHPKQFPGMLVSAAAGQTVSMLLADYTKTVGIDAIPFFAALAVGIVARLYCHYFMKKLDPQPYMWVGSLVLVPGGMGVRGVSAIIGGDAVSGFHVTFEMLVVGALLALGLFAAQLPRKAWLWPKPAPPLPPINASTSRKSAHSFPGGVKI